MHDVHSADWLAVRHLLAAPRIAARTAPHVRADDFDWDPLAAEGETMSGGERLLVDVARDLWQAGRTVSVASIPRQLDDAGFERVLEALRICRSWPLEPRAPRLQQTPWALEALRAGVVIRAAGPSAAPARGTVPPWSRSRASS
jgi:hypothetical protein